jgi:hypothetical protein
MAAMMAAPAWADCTPDPTVANGTTICTGTDANGLVVTTNGSTVRVASGAQILGGTDAAIFSDRYVTVNVDGQVTGGTHPGLLLTNGTPYYGYNDPYAGASPSGPYGYGLISPSGGASISIGAAGSISGTAAIRLQQRGDNSVGSVSADVQNSGQLVGTGGAALVADAGTFFNLVDNAATGTIGGISGRVNGLRNYGIIDGGAISAIAATVGSFSDGTLYSAGTIRSASTAATMDLAARTVLNEGRIENGGTGTAIAASGNLTVENRAGGRIASAGGTAIRTAGALQLTNAGTITGSVVSTAAAGSASTVDTTLGTITGDLLLGAGDDMLIGAFNLTTGRFASVTGIVDGGAGIDTVAARISADTTIGNFVLPTNFERFRIDLTNNAAVRLSADASAPFGLVIGGSGRFTVLGDLVTTGPAFTASPGSPFGQLSFANEGTITANLSSGTQAAIDLNVGFTNNGRITANGGDGVRLIVGTATNNGSIVSASGTGLILGSSNGASVNSGTIRGATVGVQVDGGQLKNSGTITGGGLAVAISSATLENLAGGTIGGGGSVAIGRASNFGFGTAVANAGTINGDVDLSNATPFDSSGDLFANNGGTVNGAVRLGGGDDVYVTDLGGSTGVTGSIDAGSGFDTIRYRVAADASAVLAPVATFEGVDYRITGGATLSLTAATPQTTALSISGIGKADITVDISQTDHAALTLTDAISSRIPGTIYAADDLSVISRGTLSVSSSQQFSCCFVAVNAGTANFENAGAINITGLAGAYYPTVAIQSGKAVVNSGTITLNGTIGVQYATSFINSGSIVQAAGGIRAQGVIGVGLITNSGTISVDGPAIVGSPYNSNVTNSGTIESRLDTAVQLGGYGARLTNAAGGVIRGGTVAITGDNGASIVNEGTITGNVLLGSSYSFSSNSFVSDGTLNGNLTFGSGNDLFLQRGDTSGVTGTIDGGAGTNSYGRSFDTSTDAVIGGVLPSGFQRELVEARGEATIVTLTTAAASDPSRDIYLVGDGAIVNSANLTGLVHLTTLSAFANGPSGLLASFRNSATLKAVDGTVHSFVNSGTIGSDTSSAEVVSLYADGDIAFSNEGTIRNDGASYNAVSMTETRGASLSVTNSGTISGGLYTQSTFAASDTPAVMTIANTGTISTTSSQSVSVQASGTAYNGGGSILLNNGGTIRASGTGSIGAYAGISDSNWLGEPTNTAIVIANDGTIESTGAGEVVRYEYYPGYSYTYFTRSVALAVAGSSDTSLTVRNGANGVIAATADYSTALTASGGALILDNAGTISGSGGGQVSLPSVGSFYLAGAIQTGEADDNIVSSGTITGSIDLGAGNDRIENKGAITGNVFLRDGDDVFIQHASATLTGTVDAGAGTDTLIVDATGGGAVNGDQFVNFESFSQTGTGNVAYSGNFAYDTIGLAGSTITVAAGTALSSAGAVTISGTDADETVVNRGAIAGSVALGAGNDSYTEAAGSSVGAIDGGAGTDSYVVELAGDRQGIGARSGFERLGVTGSGTLSLALDQSFDAVDLSGANLNLQLAGFTVGGVTGSAAAEQLTIDRDIARVSLGAGDDLLLVAGSTMAGSYDGGLGTDRFATLSTDPVVLTGTLAGFDTIALAGNALMVSGVLGASGESVNFGDGDQRLTIARGGQLIGTVALGAGADSFRLDAGGVLRGSVSGGAGVDAATLDLGSSVMAINGDMLRDFETLTTLGSGTLSMTSGANRYDRIDAAGGLTVAAGATLTATQVQFGAGDNRFVVAGGFAGSVDGGAGTDMIELSGGNAAAPIALQNVDGFESFLLSGGLTTIAGTGRLGRIDLTGGRLIGLAGSTLTAPQIAVGAGSTFGSAGTVVGNIAVAGTLSPGASPGTMTVTGNVALTSGSTTLFEMSSAISDKLLVSGTLAIASGATLTLTGDRPLTPGVTLDLIVANGGITGSFTTINKAATVLGFLNQTSDRIQLMGTFLATGFAPQVTATIDYTNAVLVAGQASPALLAAVPSLLTSSGSTNGAAFARLNPEAYASATQIGVENGLTLAQAARSSAAATGSEDGLFSFGQALGNWRKLGGSATAGTSRANVNSYGLMGGIGFGSANRSIGAFVGYLDGRQRIGGLGARTDADGVVAGISGHYAVNGFDASATIAYDGGKADTKRTLAGGGTASSSYRLHSAIGDVTIGYSIPVGSSWAIKPNAGLTYIATRRGSATENGSSPFALAVASRKSHATFVDGALTLKGGLDEGATIHPWIAAGVRHQLDGAASSASAAFMGATLQFDVAGVERHRTLATASAGIGVDLAPNLSLFAAYRGEYGAGSGHNLNGGLRLRF